MTATVSDKRPVTLHLNIPFCLSRCSFCTRELVEGWDSARNHAYMEALQREIAANAGQFEDCEVCALRLGGGTASMMHGADIVSLLKLIRASYAVRPDAPVSMRAAISSFSAASMPLFKRAGINRFDIEVMSLDPLAFTRYNKKDALGDFSVVCDYFLRSYTNNNLGLVLMWGLDDPDGPSFRRNMLAALNTHAVHIIMQRCVGTGVHSPASLDAQFKQAQEMFASAGFIEYAPCCFAKEGHEDPYLAAKAHGGECLGFGLGATTHFDGVISTNTMDLNLYLTASTDYTQITKNIQPVV